MDKCKFHPNRFAHVRCKTCFIPLCDECKIVTNIGVFCSEECQSKAKEFQEKSMAMMDQKPKRKKSIVKPIIGLIVIILLILGIALGLDLLKIVTLPYVDNLKELIGLS